MGEQTDRRTERHGAGPADGHAADPSRPGLMGRGEPDGADGQEKAPRGDDLHRSHPQGADPHGADPQGIDPQGAGPRRAGSHVATTTSPLALADSLTLRSEAASAVGAALLMGGMASYRVRWAMTRTARALGLDSFVSVVTFTDIIATATLDGRYRTRITQPSHVGVDVDRLARTQRMVEQLPARVSAAEVFASLGAIAARSPLYAPWLVALAAGAACAAFSFLNHGGIEEMLGVLPAAAAGQALRHRLLGRRWNHLLVTLVAASIAGTVYLLVIAALTASGVTTGDHQGGYLASVLFLVPGFPMITGLLDLVRSDYGAGLARLTYAVMIVAAAAAAVWTLGITAGIAPGQSAPGPQLDAVLALALRALATFVGVLGFALLFNSPLRIAMAAAIISVLANTLRLQLADVGVPLQLATLLATALVGVLAYLVARTRHVPRIAVSVPAVVIMIPGYSLYTAYSALNAGDAVGALMMAQEAVQVILAIALGLALAHLATSPTWRRVGQPS